MLPSIVLSPIRVMTPAVVTCQIGMWLAFAVFLSTTISKGSGAGATSGMITTGTSDRLGVPDVHTDYRELCARDDLDAVTITTPNAVHAEQALAAFAAGKHVFCEKPLGMTVPEVREMLAAAERSGRVHQVAFTFRYTYSVRELRRRVRAGDLGKLYYIRMHWDG